MKLMKTIINNSIIILVVLAISVIVYGKVNKINNASKLFQTPKERILGIWQAETDPTDKLEFLQNGKVNRYFDNVLQYTEDYDVTNSCEGQTTNSDKLFLRTTDDDGSVSCDIISDGIYEDNTQVLTLITNAQGKIIVYKRP